jgi:hypothetical protein
MIDHQPHARIFDHGEEQWEAVAFRVEMDVPIEVGEAAKKPTVVECPDQWLFVHAYLEANCAQVHLLFA